MAAGLVKGEGFAVDASIIAADASGQRGVPVGALPPGPDKAAVLEALKGGKALGAASLVLRFNH
jgi:hypothetical protein